MANFKPVAEVPSTPTKKDNFTRSFKPVSEFQPTAEAIPQDSGPPISTITGKPEMPAEEKIQRGKDVAAAGARYGLPIAAGAASGGMAFLPQMAIGGASAAMGELSARQIERAGTDPELDSLWQDIKAGGVAGATDIAVGSVFHGMGKGILAGAKRILMPRTVPKGVEAAQSVLAKAPDKQASKKWYRWKGKDPFSLSLAQLNPEEKGLVYHMESIARSGTGSTKFRQFDARNVKHVQDSIETYVAKAAKEKTGPEFGAFMNRVLGNTPEPKELFKPVEAHKAYLYDQYAKGLAKVDKKFNGSQFRNALAKTKDADMVRIYRQAEAAGALPKFSDKEAWKNLDAVDVDSTLRILNSNYSQTDELYNKRLSFMKSSLEKPFDQFVDQQPGLKYIRDTANQFNGKYKDVLHNATMKSMRRALKNKPGTVVDMMDPTMGKPAASYDTLMKVKDAFYLAAKTPAETGNYGYKVPKQNFMKDYENEILKPLRFKMFAGATDEQGVFKADMMLKRFDKVEAKAPEMLTELFGNQKQVDQVKKLFTAMDTIEKTKPEESFFIQLKTYAAIGSSGAGVYSMVSGDDPKAGVGALAGAGAIMMSPLVLAKAMTNPRLTRALYDGVTESRIFTGIGPKLGMALRKIGQQKAVSETMKNTQEADAAQFYSFEAAEEQAEE